MLVEAKARNLRMSNGAVSGRMVMRATKNGVALLVGCILLAIALAFFQPGATNVAGPVLVSSGPATSDGEPIVLEGVRPDWRLVKPGNGVTWLSGDWAPRKATSEPVAFRMSGLFSAELHWNGRMIGRKGVPGADAETEIPGLIESAILIPQHLIRNSGNHWALKISSHNAGYDTLSAIQEIEIGPYRGEGRGMDYYLPALLLFGGIAACGALAGGRFAGRRDLRSGAVAASAFLLAGALVAEVSRGAINYSYDWHIYRQSATLILLSGHIGLVVAALAAGAFEPRRPARLFPAAAAAVGALLAVILVSGFDQKTGWALGFGYAAAFALVQMRRRSSAPPPLGIILLCGLVFAAANLPDFLNAGVYAVGLALLGTMLKRDNDRAAAEKTDGEVTESPGLLVSSAGQQRMVRWADISTLRAFGNSTEVKLLGGAALEDHRGLGRLLSLAPADFLRVHKSFAVNMDCAVGVETVRRGSYRLLLTDGGRIPLSRARRAAARGAIVRAATPANLHTTAGSA